MEIEKKVCDTPDEPVKFLDYLNARGLAIRSIKEYMRIYTSMPKGMIINEDFINKMLQPRGEADAPTTYMIATLKHYLRFRKIKDYEIENIRRRKKKMVINYLTDEEYEKVRHALYKRQHGYGVMFDVMFHAGMRRSELINMTMESINNSSYHNFELGQNIIIKLTKTKNNKERYVLLPPDVSALFYKYIKAREKGERHILAPHQRIFNISSQRFAKVLREESEKNIMRRIKLHDCRRNIATRWLRNKVPIEEIQVRLGHESITTTVLYAQTDSSQVLANWMREVNGD